ncbi:M56 family metallopeptidase [Meridianimaribacter flavus]
MEYLLKSSAIIILFYLCYKLFLQRETFFTSNRWFLITGLFTAITIPFIVIPVYVEYTPVTQNFIAVGKIIETQQTEQAFNYMQLLPLAYSIGVVVLLLKFGIELFSLFSLLKKNSLEKIENHYYIKTSKSIAPFSFFNYIVYNPSHFNPEELKHIINHEKVHSKQFHSIDIIITHLATILFWFNPFMWLYKKALQQNLEFIADQEAQHVSSCEKSYQMLLVKASTNSNQLALANNFYTSLIKKRIVMLHKSKSNKLRAWKYILILPALALFLMSFNTKTVYIEKVIPIETPIIDYATVEGLDATEQPKIATTQKQTKAITTTAKGTSTKKAATVKSKTAKSTTSILADTEMFLITKDFTDADFDNLKSKLESNGASVKFKGIKRNKSNEITAIKIDIEYKNSNANYHVKGDEPIADIKIVLDEDGKSVAIGHVENSLKNIHFVSDDGKVKFSQNNGNNVVFISKDDDNVHVDKKVIVKQNVKTTTNGKSNTVIEIKTDDDNVQVIELNEDTDNEENVFVVKKDKDNVWVTKDVKTIVLTDEDGKDVEIIASENGNNSFAYSNGNPLFILDGKEISRKELKDIDPKTIKEVEVLKGEKAVEKYGDKAKDGVVIIITKKN